MKIRPLAQSMALGLVIGAAPWAASAATTNPGTVSQSPLFLSNAAKPNIILGLDDSGSMDQETLFSTNDGALWWNSNVQSFVGFNQNDNRAAGIINYNHNGGADGAWYKYVYLFPNGTGDSQSGRRALPYSSYRPSAAAYGHSHFAVPPRPEFAFARSPDYNKSYYDPATTYKPWPSTYGTNFPDSTPTAAYWDPVFTGAGSINLTQDINKSDSGWQFDLMPGMHDANGNLVTQSSAGPATFDYFPATYYLKVTKDSSGTPYTFYFSGASGTTYDCSDPKPANYVTFEANPSALQSQNVDALGPDGACLQKHEIKPGNYSTDAAYDAAIQNFANWFTYYRKRHQAMRGGVLSAFDSLTGIRVGVMRFSKRSNDVSMFDFDTSKSTLYSSIKDSTAIGGTPTREVLYNIGKQFERTDTSAPITEACQKNFSLIFTDGFANPDSTGVGNADGGKGAPYEDSYSETLADVAMHFYDTNLRSDLTGGKVPVAPSCGTNQQTSSLDCNTDLHMNTFGVTLGAEGFLFGKSYFDVADAYANPPAWQNPTTKRNPVQVDDLYHAAVNGRGEMLNADTPVAISTAVKGALTTILDSTNTASSVAFNSSTLQAGSQIFLARFKSADWSGELLAYNLDPLTGAVDPTPAWKATTPAAADRTIITYNRTKTTGGVGVPFRPTQTTNSSGVTTTGVTNLDPSMQTDLATNLPTGLTSVDRLNYLRGARANEAADKFRPRNAQTVLGDLVHSTPVYVGAPQMAWPNTAPFPSTTGDTYGEFKYGSARNRTPVVYVGGNDGMLHGFDATNGTELLAYVPQAIASSGSNEGLHYLSDPDYGHHYYVDLTPAVTDAYVNIGGTAKWRTILVGGLRGGGNGYFGLDVTDPSKFSEANAAQLALWEFTDQDDADVGETFSQPVLTMLNSTDGSGRHEWAAIFGNGYNTAGGDAELFIVLLDKGGLSTWQQGKNYFKISTGQSNDGLSSIAVADLDGNGTADRVYAGDLKGQMWAFDLCAASGNGTCSTSPADWGVAYSAGSGNNATPAPLFTAKDSSGNAQPITAKPMLASYTPAQGGGAPNIMVLFGTGQYVTDGDKTSQSVQSFYGVLDKGTGSLTRSNLQVQTADTIGNTDPNVRVPSENNVDYTLQYGWYMDLGTAVSSNDAGERVVVSPLIRGDYVFFNTMIPSTEACSYGGSGWQMSLKWQDGARPDKSVFDKNHDGVVDTQDLVDIGTGSVAAGGEKSNVIPNQSGILGDYQYTPGSNAVIYQRRLDVGASLKEGRYSWQELRN